MQKSIFFKLIIFLSFAMFQPAYADIDSSADQDQGEMSVNINTADVEELASRLAGIGLLKAGAIVAYREENGEFESISDLVVVDGIGEKILEANRPLLTVESEPLQTMPLQTIESE